MYKILANLALPANNLHYLPSCHSTNEIAQDLLISGAEEGTIVITDDQFNGKGQRGNSWHSKSGQNLTFSIILKPEFLSPKDQFAITMVMSLSLKSCLEDWLPGEVDIKWPNDIYFKGRKIAGLLIENVLRGNRFESCIIGIGLNVNQKEFNPRLNATSVALELDRDFELNTVFNTFLEQFDQNYAILRKSGRGAFEESYHNALLGYGTERRFMVNKEPLIGAIQGTDEFGRLLLLVENEIRRYQFKEIEMIF